MKVETLSKTQVKISLSRDEIHAFFGGYHLIDHKNPNSKKALKANESKEDKDYKALGKYIFKVLKGQDTREPEYVDAPEKKKEDLADGLSILRQSEWVSEPGYLHFLPLRI